MYDEYIFLVSFSGEPCMPDWGSNVTSDVINAESVVEQTEVKVIYLCSCFNIVISPLQAKSKETLGLHSVSLSVSPSVRTDMSGRTSVRLSVCRISFPDFFLKHLQILT